MRIWIPFLKLTASLPLKMGWEFLLSLANRNFLLIWIAFLWKIVPWMPDKKIVKKHGDLGVKDLMIYVRFSWIMRYQHLTKSGDSPKQNMRKDGVSSVSSRSICESLQVVFKMKKLHTTTPTLPKINLESSPAAEVNLFLPDTIFFNRSTWLDAVPFQKCICFNNSQDAVMVTMSASWKKVIPQPPPPPHHRMCYNVSRLKFCHGVCQPISKRYGEKQGFQASKDISYRELKYHTFGKGRSSSKVP